MWAIRNILTHELVTVADEKPSARDESSFTSGGQDTPWEEQIDPATEEIVELPGSAEEISSAISETIERAGEVGTVTLGDSGTATIYPSTPQEILAVARKTQENLLRDAANAEQLAQVRPFEATIVAAKYGRGGVGSLNAEEATLFNNMNTRYNKLLGLVGQVRSAPIETVKTINW